MYIIQHCFICHSSDSTVSEDTGTQDCCDFGIDRRSNHWARSHPHLARSHSQLARSHPCLARSRSYEVGSYSSWLGENNITYEYHNILMKRQFFLVRLPVGFVDIFTKEAEQRLPLLFRIVLASKRKRYF
jgi:hypothetical protein